MPNPVIIFVDTDAFVALIKEDDSNHERAKRIFDSLLDKDVIYTTSNYVFAETVTVLSQRVNHKTALAYIERLQTKEGLFQIAWVTDAIQELAIELFKEQTSKNASFVDCANIALIRDKNLSGIFSFDRIYKKNDIPLVESLIYSK